MKKLLYILLLLQAFALSSCVKPDVVDTTSIISDNNSDKDKEENPSKEVGEKETKPTQSEESNPSQTEESKPESKESSKESNTEVNPGDYSKQEDTFVDVSTSTKEVKNPVVKSWNKRVKFKGSYTTGNYGELSKYNLGFYRTYQANKNIMIALLNTPNVNPYDANSCIFNLKPYDGVFEYTIKYQSTGGIRISYSDDKSYENGVDLGSTDGFMEVRVKTDPYSYFKIETLGETVFIESLQIKCSSTHSAKIFKPKSYVDYRIDVEYDQFDNLYDGLVRRIPNKIQINNDGTYKAIDYKNYTYYSSTYLDKHLDEAEDLALTDPLDVANYYTLFHQFPLNYGYQDEISSLNAKFGGSKLTRQISVYSRTDGYATAVPYQNANGSRPRYYELDFDEIGYYYAGKGGRGVGRLVVWEAGFKNVSYTNTPVIVYTDDHYATFREYLNYGKFGTRFDAELQFTNFVWTEPITLTKQM